MDIAVHPEVSACTRVYESVSLIKQDQCLQCNRAAPTWYLQSLSRLRVRCYRFFTPPAASLKVHLRLSHQMPRVTFVMSFQVSCTHLIACSACWLPKSQLPVQPAGCLHPNCPFSLLAARIPIACSACWLPKSQIPIACSACWLTKSQIPIACSACRLPKSQIPIACSACWLPTSQLPVQPAGCSCTNCLCSLRAAHVPIASSAL